MLRLLVGSVAVLALCFGALLANDKTTKDTKDAKAHKGHKATITKVDRQHGTITVRMKDKTGKRVERTFKLTEDIRYFDSTGRVAAVDVFRSGNEVLVVEEEGHLKELHQRPKTGEKANNKTSTSSNPGRK